MPHFPLSVLIWLLIGAGAVVLALAVAGVGARALKLALAVAGVGARVLKWTALATAAAAFLLWLLLSFVDFSSVDFSGAFTPSGG